MRDFFIDDFGLFIFGMLTQRIITAAVLLILALLGIFYLPPLWFSGIAAVLILMAAWEYAKLIWQQNKIARMFFLGVLALLFIATQFVVIVPVLVIAAFWWLIAPVFLVLYSKQQKPFFIDHFSGLLVGVLLFVPCFLGLVELRNGFGSFYLLYVLCVVWAADSGAYFAGRYFGKKPLAQILSPKKTIEGVYGGVIAAMLVTIAGGLLLHVTGIKWLYLLTLMLLITLWSIIGDLFKSMLKRQAHVKDSGQILPGHGGVYDRIDSLTAAVPIFTLGLILLGL